MAGLSLTEGSRTKLMSTLLNLLLLPVIIFESGWSVRARDFASQLPYILVFAIFGTLISSFSCCALILWTNKLGLHSISHFRTALAFASLISAVDPVATLATYSARKVTPLLNVLVFGESIINDAVAIVLFNIVNQDGVIWPPGEEYPDTQHMVTNLGKGIMVHFGGSVCMGLLLGIALTFVMCRMDMRLSPKQEVLYVITSGYAAFALAEGVTHMSGIIVTLFGAFIMGIYVRPNMTKAGSLMTSYFIKQVATIADNMIFLLVGYSAAFINIHGCGIGLLIAPICLVTRALAVFPLGLLVNACKVCHGHRRGLPVGERHLLSFKHLFMMWHSCLRGGIALVLATELGPWVDQYDGEGTSETIRGGTFFIIVSFLIVFGGTTTWFLTKMGIPMGEDAPKDALAADMSRTVSAACRVIDRHVLGPLLNGPEPNGSGEPGDIEETLNGMFIGRKPTSDHV